MHAGLIATPQNARMPRILALPPLVAAALLAAGCASAPPAPGTPRAEVVQRWGPPSAVHGLPGGGERIEYGGGAWGLQTWMIDLDATGRVLQARQVRSEAEFTRLQAAYSQPPGMSGDEVLRWLGTPSEVSGTWRGGIAWSWRYHSLDCRWFWVVMDPSRRVVGSGYDLDPWCERVTELP
jgi:hypothetical protein